MPNLTVFNPMGGVQQLWGKQYLLSNQIGPFCGQSVDLNVLDFDLLATLLPQQAPDPCQQYIQSLKSILSHAQDIIQDATFPGVTT